ncbi:ubiquinone biosynthesis accessory factor UbiJ [Dyella caseinilytica]|uniref:Ubiquinone biosynthesis accessory factor UbiJ n=1 Tax=Dyella caseinilytica TaxID=1849581 RepID=A0ABX7GSS5_9GAMM|nr:SCP2 sterol-binding domain-containing protein [Dyella caseinilytica]QRN53462.1 SCP2 sterol-binding domain-containing protein [Dyella caseinilytica]GFZ86674.1 sterol-binding protein [Dyella caseinilytica]
MTAASPQNLLPQPLRKLAGRALETALNHALSLDPDTKAKLATLDGRSVQLQLRGVELALAITVEQGRLKVGPAPESSDLRVAATPGSLLSMLFRRGDDGMAPGKVEIAGDAELARRLEKLASGFAPDFEEAFARTFGDVIGVPMAKAVREGLVHARETASHLSQDGADWLRDEAQMALAPGEVESFLDDVDALRERTERLEARLARLERRRGSNP